MIVSDLQCELIEEFVRGNTHADGTYSYPEVAAFIKANDLGVPLAQANEYGLARLMEDGEKLVQETWTNLCNLLSIDPDGDYEELSDLFNG
jgi:hypothetical protein